MKLTTEEFHLLDDVLARLIDAKISGAPLTDAHLLLIIRLQCTLHEHTLAQRWDDDRDVTYCTLCGESWGATALHGVTIRTVYREDGIDWPSWTCACGCGAWG